MPDGAREPGQADAGSSQPNGRGTDAASDTQPDLSSPGECADPFKGGTRISVVPFVNEGNPTFGREVGSGFGGRLNTDLTKITPEHLTTDTSEFYIRTSRPDGDYQSLISRLWVINIGGLVSAPSQMTVDQLAPMSRAMGTVVMECSGNYKSGASFGLLSSASWKGILVTDVLSLARPMPTATRVLISGYDEHDGGAGNSTPGASWIFRFDELEQAGAFLATEMNGAALPQAHGFPVRLVMPGWFGCTCIKWVNEITLVDDSAPSTGQMREFAGRTHQTGTPALARDFRPAYIQQSAMPTRIESWSVAGETIYKVTGIMWGGRRPTDALQVKFGAGPWQDVDVCPGQTQNRQWTLWSHAWRSPAAGTYAIRMRINDATVPQTRLADGAGPYRDWYMREVQIA